MNNSDEDDAVIHEIDVCLSKSLFDNIYLVQYPLRPPWRVYENSLLQEIRFEPKQTILEMKYAIDEEELKSVREEKTVVYDLSNKPIENSIKSVTSYSIRSSIVRSKISYLMGLYRGNELFVVPIRESLQMRPNLSYINESDEKLRKKKEDQARQIAEEKSKLNLVSSANCTADTQDTLKPVKIQVKGRDAEKPLAPNVSVDTRLDQLEAEEEFQVLELVHRDRIDALVLFEQFVAGGKQNINLEKITGKAYLNMITCSSGDQFSKTGQVNPSNMVNANSDAASNSKNLVQQQTTSPLSLHTILQLPVHQQISLMMASANVMTFSQIISYSTFKDEAAVLSELNKCAFLVQGVWVIRHPPGLRDHLLPARNWALGQYALQYEEGSAKIPYLNRKSIANHCRISPEEAKEILNSLSILVPSMGWRLREGPDVEFIQSHRELYSKYMSWWQKTFQHLTNNFGSIKSDSSTQTSEYQDNSTRHSILNDPCEILGAEIKLTQAAQMQLQNFLISAFNKFGVLNLQSISVLLKQAAYNVPEFQSLNICDELLYRELPKFSMHIRDSWFLKNVADKTVDEYRTQIITLFQGKAQLQRQEIIQSIRTSLGRSIPKNIYTKIMKELATVSLQSDVWILKSGSI
ncbi:DNA-directed RNA polymerase III subunit RPC5-like [Schistocerca gregaria]|uniref:DNA-directed RNA polymerase III subunit RPC5-like n=1 Tax=Schistocerca gregaria TaxID=7010 RepID=UPI00211F09BA|nr:DNA-directed RNA polymerase III subunit RPC5-like [Schistocerca gregaria]